MLVDAYSRTLRLLVLCLGCIGVVIVVDGDAGAVEPRTSVSVFAQPRPGQPAAMIEMSVHPAPEMPPLVAATEIALNDTELVIGVVLDGQPIAYPVRYLAMVEVVNDKRGGIPVAVTWCPLSGTGTIFSRRVKAAELTFDFGTGLLGDNLLIVDRESGSVWSQIQQQSVSGDYRATPIATIPSSQLTWRAWHKRYPETKVMVFPGQRGYPYAYRDFRDTATRTGSHDISQLGLGFIADYERWYFPFSKLAGRTSPISFETAGSTFQVHYDAEGITAWITDLNDTLLSSVTAYRRAWLEFYPRSRIFE